MEAFLKVSPSNRFMRRHVCDWAQCSHAAVGVVERHREHAREVFAQWELKGHAKVALRVPTEAEMVRRFHL